MMVSEQDGYTRPSVTEYGRVESITNSKDKCGTGTDTYSQGNDLTGSVVDTGDCEK